MNKVAVIQSNYIPWKGYFDIIHDVDLFIFYDDVQYTKNDWRNRNKVKTPSGSQWLTIPVNAKIDSKISDVSLTNSNWALKHYKTLNALYSKAPYFKRYRSFLDYIYTEKKWDSLSELNQFIIEYVAKDLLGISVTFKNSYEFEVEGRKLDRLVDLLKKVGADVYVSGPSADNYIEVSKFEEAGIELVYKDYNSYPEYSQFHPPFDHYVSIFDLLFHTGFDAPYFIWGWREDSKS